MQNPKKRTTISLNEETASILFNHFDNPIGKAIEGICSLDNIKEVYLKALYVNKVESHPTKYKEIVVVDKELSDKIKGKIHHAITNAHVITVIVDAFPEMPELIEQIKGEMIRLRSKRFLSKEETLALFS